MFCKYIVRGLPAAALVFCAVVAQAITIDLVTVGNPGNAADTRHVTPGYGSVSYVYQIGKYEVTVGQYTEFLNAVADTDTYSLYDEYMSFSYECNIQRIGSPGSYTYLVDADGDGVEDTDWVNRPVTYITWGNAVRFANWLQNGQPIGPQGLSTTEDGAYFLNGAMSRADLMAVTRKPGATWVIPTSDEWYKAAFHKNDGTTGNYWEYSTRSNTTPSNQLVEPTDPGNNATFHSNGNFTIGYPYYRTEVGAHENSESPYLTFDQGGNVWEWTETNFYDSSRGNVGGSFYDIPTCLTAQHFSYDHLDPTGGILNGGFRVAKVPEPSSIIILAWIIAPALLYCLRKQV